ncbi:CRISPR-associated helicase Cas3' [Corynebacterium matruchotii]|uniref:CRISPR-associated helicase Cas3' n=1 Tax=Corynebacterium matruchotii TaxID=43768 RepID=UPI0028F135B2|nr:CRISPR-associated helicase Cas3' [Corynebacterium matruchotii]
MNRPPVAQPPLSCRKAWAKYNRKDQSWMPLYRHLDDAACTAAVLWDSWLPENARRIIAEPFGNGDDGMELARKLAIFVAAGHDIGKYSIPFATKAKPLRDEMALAGADFDTPQFSKDELKNALPHSHYSALSFKDWLQTKVTEPEMDAINAIGVILAGHHGVFPTGPTRSSIYNAEHDMHWHTERLNLWDRAAATAGLSDAELEVLATTPLTQTAQMVLTGFLIMSDWIASNQTFFPLDDTRSSWNRAQFALQRLHFPRRWQPTEPEDNQELFAASFALPKGASARPIQNTAMEIAKQVTGPSLLLIEAPTGDGKTEAALAAAEILAARLGFSGVTVALPTCATSDAMLPRLLRWLDNRLPAGMRSSLVLSHSKAQFNEEYQSLFHHADDSFESIYDYDYDDNPEEQEAVIQPHWWFTGRKTSMLSDFTIGTIDQVLFGALRSKHLALRHLGFTNKIIILDEIHAADSYMSVYLDRIITWLGALGIPVIALSATLDPARRAQLLADYQMGASYPALIPAEDTDKAKSQTSYPLISVAGAEGMEFYSLEPSGRRQVFMVEFIEDVVEQVVGQSRFGGCIGVVCNTVRRAQEVYAEVSARVDVEVVLIHSRFLAFERRRIEKDLVARLGPDAPDRPKSLIVVSTQVIEQSMDLDFDCIFSDLAPMDLLLQRAGRLHRHNRPHESRPAEFTTAMLYISGCTQPAPEEVPELDKGSCMVYGASILLRTLNTLLLHGSVITSPDDVAPLVRMTYDPDVTYPQAWADEWDLAEEKAERLKYDKETRAQDFLFPAPTIDPLWVDSGVLEARDDRHGQAQVRDIEDSLEVIVIRDTDTGFRTLEFAPEHADEPIDFGFPLDDDFSRALARTTVSLPQWILQGELGEQLLDELEEEVLDESEVYSLMRNKWLSGQLFLPVDQDLTAKFAGLTLQYSREQGMRVTKDTPGRGENNE